MKKVVGLLVVGALAYGGWYWTQKNPRMPDEALANVPSGATAVLAVNVVWTVGGLSIVAWRYSKLVVAR